MNARHVLIAAAVALTADGYADGRQDPNQGDRSMIARAERITRPVPLIALTDAAPDFDLFKQKTAPGLKRYRPMDDITFVGVPLFLSGMALKGNKRLFQVNDRDRRPNTQLMTDFKTGIDNYTQFFGPALIVGLKLGGYEGRSDWPRLLASAAMSYGIMAAFVNSLKYTAREMRPDGSSSNSWPSGHTATAFVGATMLHKEYGLTRSPLWSVAGYGVATATGVMRVLNNRHWVSDVMSGAGIGILSTELGYALSDILFKGRGLLRNDLPADSTDPSFFGIQTGIGLGGKELTFTRDDLQDRQKYDSYDFDADNVEDDYGSMGVKFRAATVVDAEGAYFFNEYIGIGSRFRVRAMSADAFGKHTGNLVEGTKFAWRNIASIYGVNPVVKEITYDDINNGGRAIEDIGGIVESSHLTEFTASGGLYLNLPLGSRFSLGGKLLIGRSFMQELEIGGYARGYVKDIQYDLTIANGRVSRDENGNIQGGITMPTNTTDNRTYDTEWDMLTIGAKSSTSYGTGLSLTYRYKSNFSWRFFVDYDSSKKNYTLKYDPFNYLKYSLTDAAYSLLKINDISRLSPFLEPIEFRKTKRMNYITLGLSFLVSV